MKEKTFKNWYTEDLELTFGIERVTNLALLEEWLAASYQRNTKEQERLQEIQNFLRQKVDFWNEEELKFYFIGQLMFLVNYDTKKYNSFVERYLSATIQDYTLKGRVDFMVATGRQIPRAPYFCLHEYKKEQGIDSDALGQLLAAMLAVQAVNNNKLPVYGTYVLGRLWFFVVLEDNKYAVSLAYDATKDDLFDIFSILQQLKVIIEGFIEKEENS